MSFVYLIYLCSTCHLSLSFDFGAEKVFKFRRGKFYDNRRRKPARWIHTEFAFFPSGLLVAFLSD